MNGHGKILDKIKKCLALSSSSNAHEAEAALRQARKLMDAHNITAQDVRAADAEEHHSPAGAKTHPANWETMLAMKVGDAFRCRVFFSGGSFWNEKGQWSFVGCGADPEVAHYAFAVLLRQARQARETHIQARLKRCRTTIKIRRADLFSEGWVRSVAGVVAAYRGSERQRAAIDAYVATHYPAVGTLKSRNRNDDRRLRDHEVNDYATGCESGRDAHLNRGVGGSDPRFVALQSLHTSPRELP